MSMGRFIQYTFKSIKNIHLFVFWLAVNVCTPAFTTVLSIKMRGHENSSTTFVIRAFSSKTGNFAVFIDLVIFQYSQLEFLLLVLILLWGCVILLFPLPM